MIEKTIYDYLSAKLDVPVFLEMPEDAPTKLVLIKKVGSGRDNHIDSAGITIQSYAESLYNTAQLNEDVKSAMFDIVELNNISSCKLNSDYNYADLELKRYRYQALFDLVYFND